MMKKVINYLFSNDLAEIPKRGRRELKSIIIDDKKFRYNKDKPISSVLTKKLLTVKKTNEYRSYALNKAKDAFSEGRVRQILTKHAIRNKFRVRDIQSAFRRYANSIVLENKHFQGERGLEIIARQKQRRSDFLRNNRSMKLNIRTEGLFETPEFDDGGNEFKVWTFGILKMLDKVNVMYTLKVWTFGILKMLDKVNGMYTLKVWTFGILKMLDKVNVLDTLKVLKDMDTLKVSNDVDTLNVLSDMDTLKVLNDMDTLKVSNDMDTLKVLDMMGTLKVSSEMDTLKVLRELGTTEVSQQNSCWRSATFWQGTWSRESGAAQWDGR